MVFKNSLTFPEAAVSAKMCSVTQGWRICHGRKCWLDLPGSSTKRFSVERSYSQ